MKWNTGEPAIAGEYLVKTANGVERLKWCRGWNCTLDPITGEVYKHHQRFDVIAWREL